MAHFILVPGLWLDASSWDDVVGDLEAAGQVAVPLTLPGLESRDADRSGVSLADQVGAVVAAVDAVPDGEDVVVVGHSMGAGLVGIAVDQRPERISRAVYIGGFPADAGAPLMAGFATNGGDLPLIDWDQMDDRDFADLDEAARAAFAERAIPSPAALATDPVELTDERRHGVPVTMVCPEFSAEEARAWVDGGDLPELAASTDVTYADIDSGHWPQFTKPAELARILIAAA